ncbi:hypothetical protein DFP72DRAFT_1077733, partial [Ephemerocybe angulata]
MHSSPPGDTAGPSSDARLVGPFILQSRFHQYIKGHSVKELRQLVGRPQPDEADMHRLSDTISAYMEHATALMDRTNAHVLRKINSSDSVNLNPTPLHPHQQDDTLHSYVQPVTHLIAALMRGGTPTLRLPMPAPVSLALSTLRKRMSVDNLHSLLVSLWLAPWESDTEAFPDPTICFLALHILQDDGAFLQPKDITPRITKLARAIQLVVLREVHRRVDTGEYPLHRIALAPLEEFIFDSTGVSTMQLLRYHNRFATALAHQTPGLPRIVWHESHRNNFTTLMYNGNIVSIDLLRTLWAKLEQNIMRLWEDKILLGTKLYIPLGTPSDSLTSTACGYSFIHDERNPFPRFSKLLGRTFLQDEKHRGMFYTYSPSTGLYSLNVSRCHQWLSDLAYVEALLMVLTDMRSGAPKRMAELCATLVCNIETRTRNLYAYGSQVLLVSQYSKNTNNHQRDRVTPHALSTFDGDMLLQIHALARPFAQYLTSLLCPGEPQISRQYRDLLFMDALRPFTAPAISQLMGDQAKAVLGWSMTVAPWRHIAIVLKDVFKLDVSDQEEEPDAFSEAQAEQSGHSMALEKRIYGLSPNVIEGIKDSSLAIFIRASCDWQIRFQVVPSGVALPYYSSTMDTFHSHVSDGTIQLPPPPISPSTIQDLYNLVQRSYSDLQEFKTAFRDELRLIRSAMQCTQRDPDGPPPVVAASVGLCSDLTQPTARDPHRLFAASQHEPLPNLTQPVTRSPLPPSSSPSYSEHRMASSPEPIPSGNLGPLPSPPSSAGPPTLDRHPTSLRVTPNSLIPRTPRPTPIPTPAPPVHFSELPMATPPVLRPSDMLVPLQDLYGPQANWRDVGQRDALAA